MNVIKEGYKATITDKEGVVMDIIPLGGYNLEKPLARADIIAKIQDALPGEAFDPPEEGGKIMPFGIPRTEGERIARHREFFGGPPPPERLGLGPKYEEPAEVLWDLLPTLPLEHGLLPPMPRLVSRQLYKAITGKLPGEAAGKR